MINTKEDFKALVESMKRELVQTTFGIWDC